MGMGREDGVLNTSPLLEPTATCKVEPKLYPHRAIFTELVQLIEV
jgi:hypothetical protein